MPKFITLRILYSCSLLRLVIRSLRGITLGQIIRVSDQFNKHQSRISLLCTAEILQARNPFRCLITQHQSIQLLAAHTVNQLPRVCRLKQNQRNQKKIHPCRYLFVLFCKNSQQIRHSKFNSQMCTVCTILSEFKRRFFC